MELSYNDKSNYMPVYRDNHMPVMITQEKDRYSLDQALDYYNWDHGFELQYQIINHSNCELATALKAFYFAQGDQYLQNKYPEQKINSDQLAFLKYLYDKTVSGYYLELEQSVHA